jgi:copper chaperone CopZ
MLKKTLRISGMHCSNCAMMIESLEDDLPGIRSISASYTRSQVVVEFDESLLDIEAIIQAIRSKGYTATSMSL